MILHWYFKNNHIDTWDIDDSSLLLNQAKLFKTNHLWIVKSRVKQKNTRSSTSMLKPISFLNIVSYFRHCLFHLIWRRDRFTWSYKRFFMLLTYTSLIQSIKLSRRTNIKTRIEILITFNSNCCIFVNKIFCSFWSDFDIQRSLRCLRTLYFFFVRNLVLVIRGTW